MWLHDGGRAPNPRRVQIFLKEKSIEIERVQYDINALEQKSQAFTRLNPMQTLPVLELDDGTAIGETVAICRYFEETVPEPNLMGQTPLEKAQIEMWQRRAELSFLLPVAFAFRHLHPGASKIEPVQIEEWGRINQQRAVRFMGILDKELASRDYVAGSRFTIADITTFVACQFMKPARIAMDAAHRNLAGWFARIGERPSAAFD
ncbi:glutathione S-transferase family protein [Salaquimonas pukyongi]|uniref:glutathione S-transferase family protein n=1 Tax=Salaquimonas pukyongi TaxID=2712698 RepID=UPI00096B7432|nr:glutathione S-transferase [Salaquimonas pukyongi]